MVTEKRADAYQFFSRSSFAIGARGALKIASFKRPDIVFYLKFEYANKPFEMDFAQVRPQRLSSGAYEYNDPDIEAYFSKRWPTCLKISGTVQFPDKTMPDDVCRDQLLFLRRLLWEVPSAAPNPDIPPDQRATVLGYRREFFHWQFFDFMGKRRPSNQAGFVSTELGEPIGPGLACFPDLQGFERINELVWSPILPFPNRSTFDQDKLAVIQAVNALQKQYNSYSELGDAQRHLKQVELKAAVRSAASAVDACIRHLQDAWGVSNPPPHLPFDEKIEHILRSVNKPSYQTIESDYSKKLLYLYRARNSMHEGGCYYDRDDGQRIQIRTTSQVEQFIDAVESFVLWVDSVV